MLKYLVRIFTGMREDRSCIDSLLSIKLIAEKEETLIWKPHLPFRDFVLKP
jgi:hypothetical protein